MTLPIPTPVHLPCIQRPESVPIQDVCPHSKRRTVMHSFMTGEFRNVSHHCPEHGAVIPMRSAVTNRY